jgi:hypothetical protein
MRLYDQTNNSNSFTILHINTRLLTSPASEIMRLDKKEVAHAAHSDQPAQLLWRPACLTAGGGSATSLTPTSTTTSLTQNLTTFEDIWSDSAPKLSDDWSDVEHDSHIARAAWPAPNAPAMAEDFSEGRYGFRLPSSTPNADKTSLETLVGSPQKELAGTQNAFVSYLVTTKVHFPPTLCAAF